MSDMMTAMKSYPSIDAFRAIVDTSGLIDSTPDLQLPDGTLALVQTQYEMIGEDIFFVFLPEPDGRVLEKTGSRPNEEEITSFLSSKVLPQPPVTKEPTSPVAAKPKSAGSFKLPQLTPKITPPADPKIVANAELPARAWSADPVLDPPPREVASEESREPSREDSQETSQEAFQEPVPEFSREPAAEQAVTTSPAPPSNQPSAAEELVPLPEPSNQAVPEPSAESSTETMDESSAEPSAIPLAEISQDARSESSPKEPERPVEIPPVVPSQAPRQTVNIIPSRQQEPVNIPPVSQQKPIVDDDLIRSLLKMAQHHKEFSDFYRWEVGKDATLAQRFSASARVHDGYCVAAKLAADKLRGRV